MSGSYQKINYSLRPAKAIERKMLCEGFRRLNEFAALDSYRYVGLGSTYFSDFVMMHKSLGLTDMISIEKDSQNQERFNFNVPYKCIKLEFGDTNDVLPKLPWEFKSIVWLDYDDALNLNILYDIQCIFTNLVPGSMLVVSCNAMLGEGYTEPAQKLQILKENLGEKVPADIDGKNLGGWKTASLYREIIHNEIEETVANRNGARPKNAKLEYRQTFHFNYADGAKMLTVGGILFEKGEKGKVEKCGFDDLNFTRVNENEKEAYKIEVPNLTYKELRYLDSQLPHENLKSLKKNGIPTSDITKYADFYRYFPNYVEIDI